MASSLTPNITIRHRHLLIVLIPYASLMADGQRAFRMDRPKYPFQRIQAGNVLRELGWKWDWMKLADGTIKDGWFT